MFGSDPYLDERLMAQNVEAARREAERLGSLSLSLSTRRLALRYGLLLVALGGRLVRAGLPPYRAVPRVPVNCSQDAPAGCAAA